MVKSIKIFSKIGFRIMPKITSKILFKLFLTPLGPKLNTKQKLWLEEYKFQTLNNNNRHIQIYKWGTGKTKLLFLHGWTGNSYRWRRFIEKFDLEKYSIFAFDAPAHGLSTGKRTNLIDFHSVFEDVIKIIGPVDTAIGHSFGGFVLSYALFVKPEIEIQKVAILGSPVLATHFFDYYKSIIQLKEDQLNRIMDNFEKYIGKHPRYFDGIEFAKNIEKKAIIIHDINDLEAPYANAVQMHNNWRNSKLVSTTKEGHRLTGDSIIDLILEFVKE